MKTIHILAVLLAFLTAAALRIGLVDRHSLWSDEFFSLATATGHSLDHHVADPLYNDFAETAEPVSPAVYSRYLEHENPAAGLGRVLRATFLSDTSPPLYYILLWGWTRAFGTSDIVLRLLSVVCSLLCLPFIWLIGNRIGGPRAGLFAVVLAAVSPLFVYYSTEGRMYSMLILCSTLTMWATLRLSENKPNIARFGFWALVSAAGMLTHYFFVFVWLVAFVWLLWRWGGRQRLYAVAASSVMVILVLPWYAQLPQALLQAKTINSWLTIQPGSYHPVKTCLLLPWRLLSPDLGDARTSMAIMNAIVFVSLAAISLKKLPWSFCSGQRTLVWAWLLAPCVGVFLFDFVQNTYTASVTRYVLSAMPAAFVLVGLALSRLDRRSQLVFFSLIVALSLAGDRRLYLAEARVGQPYLKVVHLLENDVQTSDIVIVHSVPSGVVGLARYLKALDDGKNSVNMVSWVEGLGRRHVPDDVIAFAGGHSRIILVRIHDSIYERVDRLDEQRWLEQNARLTKTRRIGTATICYFEPKNATRFP